MPLATKKQIIHDTSGINVLPLVITSKGSLLFNSLTPRKIGEEEELKRRAAISIATFCSLPMRKVVLTIAPILILASPVRNRADERKRIEKNNFWLNILAI